MKRAAHFIRKSGEAEAFTIEIYIFTCTIDLSPFTNFILFRSTRIKTTDFDNNTDRVTKTCTLQHSIRNIQTYHSKSAQQGHLFTVYIKYQLTSVMRISAKIDVFCLFVFSKSI